MIYAEFMQAKGIIIFTIPAYQDLSSEAGHLVANYFAWNLYNGIDVVYENHTGGKNLSKASEKLTAIQVGR